MTEPWHFISDGVSAADFEKMQRLLRHAARRMSEPQILTLADGLYEICMLRREQAGLIQPAANAPHPRRRWTDRAVMMRPGGLTRPFSEILEEAIRAAEEDRARRGGDRPQSTARR